MMSPAIAVVWAVAVAAVGQVPTPIVVAATAEPAAQQAAETVRARLGGQAAFSLLPSPAAPLDEACAVAAPCLHGVGGAGAVVVAVSGVPDAEGVAGRILVVDTRKSRVLHDVRFRTPAATLDAGVIGAIDAALGAIPPEPPPPVPPAPEPPPDDGGGLWVPLLIGGCVVCGGGVVAALLVSALAANAVQDVQCDPTFGVCASLSDACISQPFSACTTGIGDTVGLCGSTSTSCSDGLTSCGGLTGALPRESAGPPPPWRNPTEQDTAPPGSMAF